MICPLTIYKPDSLHPNTLKSFPSIISNWWIECIFADLFLARKSFECPNCAKRFTWKSTLSHHKRYECGKVFICNKCKKKFRSSYGYNMHAKNGCEAMFQCNKCAKKYFSAYALKRHTDDCIWGQFRWGLIVRFLFICFRYRKNFLPQCFTFHARFLELKWRAVFFLP